MASDKQEKLLLLLLSVCRDTDFTTLVRDLLHKGTNSSTKSMAQLNMAADKGKDMVS